MCHHLSATFGLQVYATAQQSPPVTSLVRLYRFISEKALSATAWFKGARFVAYCVPLSDACSTLDSERTQVLGKAQLHDEITPRRDPSQYLNLSARNTERPREAEWKRDLPRLSRALRIVLAIGLRTSAASGR